MSRPRILITPAVFLSASIATASAAQDAPVASATDARRSGHADACAATSGTYGILARFAHVCHTR